MPTETVPFTISSDIDLGLRVEPYLSSDNSDVLIFEHKLPEKLHNATAGGISYDIAGREFLLRIPDGTRYLVRNGDEIRYQRGPHTSDRDVALFLLGSAWGALCYQRDLLPIHASAVVANGNIYAFTGQSGAGKSTLAAALADRQMQFFTDDVLIVDANQLSVPVTGFAGQKDLKLWQASLKLTRAKKMGPVRDATGFEKYFAIPANSASCISGNLAALLILASGNKINSETTSEVTRIRGGRALKQLSSSVYRPRFAEQIWGRKKLYETIGKLITAISVYNFQRPFNEDEFDSGIDFIKYWIEQNAVEEKIDNLPGQ